jgi:hypothetical protein
VLAVSDPNTARRAVLGQVGLCKTYARRIAGRATGYLRTSIRREATLGLAWTAATFLVVPILAAEGIGPWRAIERSTALLRKTWGENLIGNAGISLVMSMISGTVGLMGVGGGMLLFRLGRRLLGTALLSATDHKPLADSLGCRRAVGDLRRGRLPLRRGGHAAGGLRRRPDPRRLHAQGHIIGACGHQKHAKR